MSTFLVPRYDPSVFNTPRMAAFYSQTPPFYRFALTLADVETLIRPLHVNAVGLLGYEIQVHDAHFAPLASSPLEPATFEVCGGVHTGYGYRFSIWEDRVEIAVMERRTLMGWMLPRNQRELERALRTVVQDCTRQQLVWAA